MPDGPTNEHEEVARECGLRLLEISGIYERGVVGYEAGHETLSIAGLVGRQRRLLRAAYLLAGEGQRLEASIMLRAMLEFLIRQKWNRFDSLRAAHPSPMAIEQLFEDRPDLGGIRLMPEPPRAVPTPTRTR